MHLERDAPGTSRNTLPDPQQPVFLYPGGAGAVSAAEPIVFVVEDNRALRDAIRVLLESVELRVETYRTAEQFLGAPRPDAPSCLVLDVRLPGVSGLELQRQLVRTGAPIPTVFITGHGDVPMSVQAMKAGAVEFLTKPFRDQQLLDAVQQALEQDRIARVQRAELADLQRRFDALTSRERAVMRFVVGGLLNKQIARRLGTSEITVKVRRARMMDKMRAQSLVELARMAARLGIA
jgi:FixJ family two-component response regulator